jgi:hypothetical protein
MSPEPGEVRGIYTAQSAASESRVGMVWRYNTEIFSVPCIICTRIAV